MILFFFGRTTDPRFPFSLSQARLHSIRSLGDLEDIKEVACACRTVESGCEAHVIDVDTARYPNIHPHNVQSGEDLPTIHHVEEIIFSR